MRIILAPILNFVPTISLLVLLRYEGSVKKNFLIAPHLWGEVRLFHIVLRLCGTKKNCQARPKIFL